MKQVIFFIPGKPMSKQRPRSSRAGHMYTPAPTVQFENLVKTVYLNLKNKAFWDNEPMSMVIVASFAIPASYSNPRKRQCELGQISPSNKDCDNIAKIVCDGLNAIAYSDDKHIVQLEVVKNYVLNPEEQGIYVYITDYRKSLLPDIIVKRYKEDINNG